MEASHSDGACDAAGVDIALEVVAADHTALAHLIAAFENLVLALGIDFGKHKRCGPAD